MKIKEQKLIYLDPAAHQHGVECFMDYYKLNPKPPGLSFLQDILQNFSSIPYENLSKIIKLKRDWEPQNKIRLPEEVIEEHISHKLGGTCFSLTFFLQSILTNNNFICYPVMANMRSGKNIHCCLIVNLNSDKYLVDPGYLLTLPIQINPDKHRPFKTGFTGIDLRFDTKTSEYNLFTFDKNKIKWRYRFQDRPVSSDEFLQHWLASFQRNSMQRIYLTKAMNGELVYVRNHFLRKTTFNGKQNFNIRNNFHKAINEVFGIDKQLIEEAQVTLKENLLS